MKRSLLVLLTASLLVACSSGPQEPPAPQENGPAFDVTGTWTARVPFEDFSEVPGETIPEYAGMWSLVLDQAAGTYLLSNEGYGRSSGELRFEGTTAILDDPPAPEGAFNCFVDGERTFTEGSSRYRVMLRGDRLTFTALEEPCPLRGAVVARAWTR